MMSEAYVYVFQLRASGVFYIGSTSDFSLRISQHLKQLENGTHHNKKLQQTWSFDKDWEASSIKVNDRKTAFDIEELWIRKYAAGPLSDKLANIGLSSFGGDNITRHPDKDKIVSSRAESQKISLSSMTKKEKSLKYGRPGELNWMFRKTHTEEARRKISEKNKGHTRSRGRVLSEKHKRSLSAKAKMRIGEKNPFYGKTHSKETREKLSQYRTGKPNSKCWVAVSVDGVEFQNYTKAAEYFKISVPLLLYRIKSHRYPGWIKLKETNTA